MSETPRYEPPENPASSSIARVQLRAQLIGEETAAQVYTACNAMGCHNHESSMVTAGNRGRRAQADELFAHTLLTPEKHARMVEPIEDKGNRGVCMNF